MKRSPTLFELCPACGGKGTLTTGKAIELTQPCPICNPRHVVETGMTVRQMETTVERATRFEMALLEILGFGGRAADVARAALERKAVKP